MVKIKNNPMLDELMVQQQIETPWQHMVGVIMLNQTHRKTVKKVLPEFLSLWSTAPHFLTSDPSDVYEIIKPLGLVVLREKRLRRMSQDYLSWNGENARLLYGIGKYGSDSYEIFFKQNFSVQPNDKELIRYLNEEVDQGQRTIL